MSKTKVVINTSFWFRSVLALASCFFIGLSILNFSFDDYLFYGLLALSLFSIVAFTDALLSKLIFTDSQLMIRANFKTRTINRTEVQSIKKDGGKVFLLLQNNQWHDVPDLGQNTIKIYQQLKEWHK